MRAAIDSEMIDLTEGQIRLDLSDEIFSVERFDNFKKFLWNHCTEPRHLNGVITAIHKLKQEYLFKSFDHEKGSVEHIDLKHKYKLIKMYWDCAIYHSTLMV